MFWGQLSCESCGYESEDFMWMWHHNMSHGILLQDRKTLGLRVLWIPDDEAFQRRPEESSQVVLQRSEALIDRLVARAKGPTERRVAVTEFANFEDLEGDELSPTHLLCPKCRSGLSWRNTGIS